MKHGFWDRRTLMSGLGAGAAALAFGRQTAAAQAPASAFQPAHHAEDEWLDKIPGKHRAIFDVTSPDGVAQAMAFTNNIFTGNKNGYSLNDSDLAVVIVLRHNATAFAFMDPMWAKYGKAIASAASYTNPRSTDPPAANPSNTAPRNALDALAKRGVQFAVCDMAAHRFARAIAGQGGDAEAVYKELAAHLVTNGRLVPAGVVAVTRAQEYGYSLVSIG